MDDGSNFVDIAVDGIVQEFPDIAEHVLAIKGWYESEEGKRQVAEFLSHKGEYSGDGTYGKAAKQYTILSVLALVPAAFCASMAIKYEKKKEANLE